MPSGARGLSPFPRDDEDDYRDQEDLEAENARLRQELSRARRNYRSSSAGRETLRPLDRRFSLNTSANGRAQEQLREVIEENDLLVERMKMKEKEMEELAQENARLQKRLEEEQCQHLAAKETKDSQPKDIRLFKRHAQDIMKRMQEEKEVDLAKADQARKLLKMQVEDSQARCAKAKSEIVRLERELSHAEAFNLKQEMKIRDLQQHTEELRGMLDGERNAVEQMQLKASRLEEELENERLSKQNVGETLDMLDTGGHYRSSIDSQPDSLCGLMEDGLPEIHSRSEPEISGRLEQQVAELQQECEQLRAQLAIAKRTTCQGAEERSPEGERVSLPSEEAQQECRDLRQHLTEARAELASLQGQLAESWRERAALQEQLASVGEASQTSQPKTDHFMGTVPGATVVGQKAIVKNETQRGVESEELRGQLAAAEAQLAGARRENETLQKMLASADERAKGLVAAHRVPEGSEELRERIAFLESQLEEAARRAQSPQPQEPLHDIPGQLLSNTSTGTAGQTSAEDELRRECQRLRERLAASGDKSFDPGPAPATSSHTPGSPEAQLEEAKAQLAEANGELERMKAEAAATSATASANEVACSESENHGKPNAVEPAPRPCLRSSFTSSSTITTCSTPATADTSTLSCQSYEGWQEELIQTRDELAQARDREKKLQEEAKQLRLQLADHEQQLQQKMTTQEDRAASDEKQEMAEEVKSLQLNMEALGKLTEERHQELQNATRDLQDLRQQLDCASQRELDLTKALEEREQAQHRAVEAATSQLQDQAKLTESLHAAKTAETEAQQAVAEMQGMLLEVQGRANEMEKKAADKLVWDQNKAAELGAATQQKEARGINTTPPPSKSADGPARHSVATADGIRASRLSVAVCRSCESLRQELANANERQHKLQLELREEMLQKNEELLAGHPGITENQTAPRNSRHQLDPDQEKEKESETYPVRFVGEPKDLQESLQAAKAAESEARKRADELQTKVEDVPVLVSQIQDLKLKLAQVEKQATPGTTNTKEGQEASAPCPNCESLRQELATARQEVRDQHDLARRNEELVAASSLLQQQLETLRDKTASDLPSASSLAEEAGKLSQQCEQLRERLHAAKLAELEAQRKADEVPALMSQVLDLKLKLVIAEKRAVDCKKDLELFRSPSSGAASRQPGSGSSSDRQLAEAREQLQRLEREVTSLKQQVADSQQLEQEHKRAAEVMRKQLADACGTPVVVVSDVETNSLQLAGAKPAGGGQRGSLQACGGLDERFLAGEREEMGRRIEELLATNQKLFQQLQEAQTMGDATCAEMVKTLWQECERLREQLHAAKMAELDAQKKADEVPGLMTQILDLKKQATALEREVQEWKRAATETSFSGLFSSFVCAGPGSRQR